jgi:AcrR family transcriptional regulator
MPRPRFSRLEPERRLRILEAAGAEFATHGFQQASLNRIIDALGLSKGVFYYYFDSKADLFGAVVEMVWDLLFPDLVDVAGLERETFWPEIERVSEALRRRVRDLPWLAGIGRLLYQPMPDAGLDHLVAAKFGQARAWLAALLERGQAVGAVRRDLPLDLLLAVLMAADQAADRWLAERWDRLDADRRDDLVRRIFTMWRRLAEPADAARGVRA